MANPAPSANPWAHEKPRRARRWLRRLAVAAGGAVLLLFVAYFVLTSAAFLKAVILPKVGSALGAAVTIEDASISPFSSVVLRGLKVRTTGEEPLLTARQARAHYSLWDIIGGQIKVADVTLDSPTIILIRNADGTSNLDPILQATASKPGEKPAPPSTQPAQPVQIDLSKFAINNASVRVVTHGPGGGRDIQELANVNLSVANLKNGQAAQITLNADASLDRSQPAPGTNASLQARLESSVSVELTSDLQPAGLKASLKLNVTRAAGAFAEAANFALQLDADVGPTEIRPTTLRFQRAGADLGQLRVSGPFDLAKTEGTLKLELFGIDRGLLGIVGAAAGLDFGNTSISSTQTVVIANAGKKVSTQGLLHVAALSVKQQGFTTPVLDLSFDYDASVDLAASVAELRAFSLTGQQNQQPLLLARLAGPMTVAWGNNANAVPDAGLSLVVTNLNLADYRAFAPEFAAAGIANLSLAVQSKQGGKELGFTVGGAIERLAATVASNKFNELGVTLSVAGQASDLKKFTIGSAQLAVTRQAQPLVSVGLGGTYDTVTQGADLQLTLDSALVRLLALAPQPDLSLTDGRASLQARVTQAGTNRAVTGTFQLASLTGRQGTLQLQDFNLDTEFDLGLAGPALAIRKATGTLRPGSVAGGGFAVSGHLNLDTKAGAITAKLTDVNENLLRPFLADALGERRLGSVVINATTATTLGADGATDVKADLTLANLVLHDPSGQVPATPLGFTMALDTSLRPQTNGSTVDLRQFALRLTTAGQPAGDIEAKGLFDLARKSGQFNASIAGLNENILRPALASSLGERKLISVAINATASGNFDAAGDGACQANLDVANLLVHDPANPALTNALAVKLRLDAALQKQVAEVRQCVLSLAPTTLGKNELTLSGRVDFSKTNALEGALKLAAESLDLTPCYDLFAGQPPSAVAPSPTPPIAQAPPPPPVPAGPEQEPAAVHLPIRDFTFEASIGRCHLRELAITNLVAITRITNDRVRLSPFQLTLNGRPMSASVDANLGVPGFEYAVAFHADALPVEPIANSFAAEYRGRAKGDLIADVQIKGAGVTGPSLQKNLAGAVHFAFTNANLQIAGAKAKALIFPIALVLGIPDLSKSPINWLTATATVGAGRVTVRQVNIVSEAFTADTGGDILLQPVLTNSPIQNWPVNFALRRSLAGRLNLGSRDGSTGEYSPLPRFVTVQGTLGAPETKTDKLALLAVGANLIQAIPGVSGTPVGNTLDKVGGLFGGRTNAAPPAPDKPAPLNPLDLFRRPKKP